MNTSRLYLLATALVATFYAWPSAKAAALDDLQGQWSVHKTNSEGRVRLQSIQFKGDRLDFQIQDADRQVIFVARGRAEAERQGSLQILRLTNIEAGRSADDLQKVDDDRTSIFTVREDALYLASNFDKVRENQAPVCDIYRRGGASAAAAPAPNLEAKLAGEWNMDLTLGDNSFDYRLQFSRGADGTGWRAKLISPRSGQYDFKSVRVQENELTMEITRTFDGNDVQMLYKGKLNGAALEGTVTVPAAGNQFSGTWKARK